MAKAPRGVQPLCAEADEVANDLLFRTGKMLETGEAHWIKDCFHLPQTVETSVGKRRLLSEACVIDVFESVRKFYEAEKITSIARAVITAERLAPDLIGSVHVAKLIKDDGETYRAPYPVYSLIRKIHDRWKISSTLYAILDSSEHNHLLCARPADFQEESFRQP